MTEKSRFFFFVFAFCFCIPLLAQQSKIDSLKMVLHGQKDDTNKVNTLTLLTRQIYLTGNYDTTLFYAHQAQSLAEKIRYKKGLANAYNNIGNVYLSLGNYPEALKSHSTSLALQKEIHNRQGIASSYNNIGSSYFYQGNYPEALKNYLAALKIYESPPVVKINLASSYNNIGNVYFTQGNYPEALKNYSAALKIRAEIDDKHGLAASYGNVGNVYYSLGNYPEALKNHFTSLQIKQEIGDQQGIAASYGNIGSVYFNEGSYPEALENFFASEKAALAIGDKLVLANAYSNIGTTYVKQHKGAAAIEYLNKALALGKETGGKDILKNSYNGLEEADSLMGNWKAAYVHHKLFILYRDSLQSEENTQKITQAQMNFDFEQKETKLKAAEEKREAALKAEQDKKELIYQENLKRKTLINWFIAAALLLVFLSALLVFNRYRLKQKHAYQQELNQQQKQQAVAVMETQEQERKRIAEDLHDSLGHLLSTAKLNLQTFPESQKHLMENPLALLNQASHEIHNITFNLMPRTLEEEGLIPALKELAAKITASGSVAISMQVHGMEKMQLEKQAQFNIYRIIQEAVNNILKHAAAKEISIQLIGQGQQLTIMVEDDGKGFDAAKAKKSGRGLRNIHTRSAWLNGHTSIDSSPGRGTTLAIEIPV